MQQSTALVVAGLMFVAPARAPGEGPGADVVVENAAIWTGDDALPEAEAIAILGDRIVAVGTNEEIGRWRVESTRVIDAGGKWEGASFTKLRGSHEEDVDGRCPALDVRGERPGVGSRHHCAIRELRPRV